MLQDYLRSIIYQKNNKIKSKEIQNNLPLILIINKSINNNNNMNNSNNKLLSTIKAI